jgi:hypothetical protein
MKIGCRGGVRAGKSQERMPEFALQKNLHRSQLFSNLVEKPGFC